MDAKLSQKSPGLQIVTKPLLGSNKRLEEDFTAEIFRRVERTSRSKAPQFLLFRPQCRPKEEFDVNIAPLLKKELSPQHTILVSISNNTEKGDAYLDDTEFKFKLKVKFILTEGRLDIDRNGEALLKLTNMLIDEYGFRKLEEGNDNQGEEQDKEMIEKSEEIRSQLTGVKELVTLLILNDKKSKYTTSLLSALEGNVVPYQGVMVATQFRAYKWNNIQIIDPGFSEDIDLVEAFLNQVSKNGIVGIIVVQPKGSEVDVEDKKKKIKSISAREGASWHIVVTTETAEKLEQLPLKSDLPKENIHFVKICTDKETDSCLNLGHLTVLKDIVDCVIKYSVRDQARRRWWFSKWFITPAVILVPVIACALSATCVKSVFKIPMFILNKCFYHIQRFLHYANSFIWSDS